MTTLPCTLLVTLTLCLFLPCSTTVDGNDEPNEYLLFEKFKVDYNRNYNSPDEEARRFDAFKNTLSLISHRNAARRSNGGRTDVAVHGVTQFADMTPQEFKVMSKSTLKSGSPLISDGMPYPMPYFPPAPAKRSKNWVLMYPSVSPIRDQDKCGGCWAYATVETIRMQFKIRHGKDPGMLSAEYLLDCATPAWTAQNCSCWSFGSKETCYDGCCGGTGLVAANWITGTGGLPTADEYGGRGNFDKDLTYNVSQSAADPFKAWACNATIPKTVRTTGPPIFFAPGKIINMTIPLLMEEKEAAAKGGRQAVLKLFCDKFGICPVNGTQKYLSPETLIAKFLVEVGPVQIGVSDNTWGTYTSGVMTATGCSNTTQSHSVEIVGLDADKQAWIVRNHWGPKWGVSPIPPYLPASQTPGGNGGGYILLAFGENTCRLAELGFAQPFMEAMK